MTRLLLMAAVVLASPPGGFSIEGRVEDATGGVVAEASVSLLSPQQAPVASTRSDAQGRFRFDSVSPGSYLVVVQAPGFAAQRTAVLVKEGAPAPSVNIVLEPRAFGEEVTVSARLGNVDDVGARGPAGQRDRRGGHRVPGEGGSRAGRNARSRGSTSSGRAPP